MGQVVLGNKTGWQRYFEVYKTGRERGQTYMPGSLFCPHGFEAGKECDICYEEWLKENNEKSDATQPI